jgi:hypothetical protein
MALLTYKLQAYPTYRLVGPEALQAEHLFRANAVSQKFFIEVHDRDAGPSTPL